MKNMYRKPFYVFASLFISLILAFQTNAQTPTISAVQQPTDCGATTLTVDIVANDFPAIVGLSHMLTWDPTKLVIDRSNLSANPSSLSNSISNFSTGITPNIVLGNFTSSTDSTLGFSWVFNSFPFQEQTLGSDEILYSITFDVIGDISTGVQLRQFPEEDRPTMPTPRNTYTILGSGGSAPSAITDYTGVDAILMLSGTDNDNQAPMVTCLSDTTRLTTPVGVDYIIPDDFPWDVPTVTDNCSIQDTIVTINGVDIESISVLPTGFTTITYSFTDDANNVSDLCGVIVEVTEESDPNPSNVVLSASSQSVDCEEDTVMVNITMQNFESITSIQHILTWDSTLLNFEEVININPSIPIPDLNDILSVFPSSPNMFRFVWSTSDSLGLDFANDDILYTIVFSIENNLSANIPTLVTQAPNNPAFPNQVRRMRTEQVSYSFNDGLITSSDTEPPVFLSFPESRTDTIEGDGCTLSQGWDAITFTDNCGAEGVRVDSTQFSGADFPAGRTHVIYILTDEAGNVAMDSFLVTIVEREAPTINSCPDDINAPLQVGADSIEIPFTAPEFADNCDIASITSNFSPNDLFPIGSTEVIYTAVDSSGNTATCSFLVNYGSLTLTCPEDSTFFVGEGSCEAFVNGVDPMVTDAGAVDTTIIYLAGANVDTLVFDGLGSLSGSFLEAGMTSVTYEITDTLGGEAQTCTFNINVRDTLPPILTCPNLVTVSTTDTTTTVDLSAITIFDACSDTFLVDYSSIDDPNVAGNSLADLNNQLFGIGTTNVSILVADGQGNFDQCQFQVQVEALSISVDCPSDTVITLDAGVCSIAVDDIGLMLSDSMAFDSVRYTLTQDGMLLEEVSDTSLLDVSGTVFEIGTTTVSYFITDTLDVESLVCEFDVVVEDITPPTIICVDDQLIRLEAGDIIFIVGNNLPINAFDDCSPEDSLSITYSLRGATTLDGSGSIAGDTLLLGTTLVEVTVADESGNPSVCTFEVLVTNSQIEPDCPANVIDFATDECGLIVNDIDVEIENDSLVASTNYTLTGATEDFVTSSDSMRVQASGTFFNVGRTDVEYEAIDMAGDSVSCSFFVEIRDNIAPVITCPADTTVLISALDSSVVINDISLLVEEACDVTITYGLSGATMNPSGLGDASGTSFKVGVTTLGYSATDASGNSSPICLTEITVVQSDIELQCPPDTTLSTASDTCGNIVGDIAIAILSDTASTRYRLTGATDSTFMDTTTVVDASGLFFNIGTTNVTYTVTDSMGTSVSCGFEVTVNDDIIPVLTCIGDTIINLITDSSVIVNNIGIIDIAENCDTIDVIYNLTGEMEGTRRGDASGTTFPLGITNVEYSVTDENGNIGTCEFDVEVKLLRVEVDCPSDTIINVDPTTCTATFDIVKPTILANADIIDSVLYNITTTTTDNLVRTSIDDPVPTQTLPIGTTNINITIKDTSGFSVVCDYQVEVQDTTMPSLICPADIIASLPMGMDSMQVEGVNPTFNQNCENDLSLTYRLVGENNGTGSGSVNNIFFKEGTTTVTYFIGNSEGLVDSCDFEVTVNSVLLTIICQPDRPANTVDTCGRFVNNLGPIVSPLESLDSMTYILSGATDGSLSAAGFLDASGVFLNPGVTTVTYIAKDILGGEVTCNTNILVRDRTTPTFDCPADRTVTIAANQDTAFVSDIAVQNAMDNCVEQLTITYEKTGATDEMGSGDASGTAFALGTTTLTYTVSDPSGNSNTCSFDITVVQSDVSFACPSDSSLNVEADNCGATVSGLAIEILEGATAIDSITYSLSGATMGMMTADSLADVFFNAGVTTVTYEVTDSLGGVSSCAFTVNVVDNIAPMIVCPADVNASITQGATATVVNIPAPTTSDNCAVDQLTYSTVGETDLNGTGDISGQTFNQGTTIVTYKVFDAAGNVDSCSFNVIVAESAIELDCPGNRSFATDDTTCDAAISDWDVDIASGIEFIDSARYELSGATMDTIVGLISNLPARVFNLGTTTVNFTAFDSLGGTAACSYQIEVIDSTAPIVICPDAMVFSLASRDSMMMVTGLTPISISDNCSISDSIDLTYALRGATTGGDTGSANGAVLNRGTTTVTYFVEDQAGNVDSCSFNVTLVEALLELSCVTQRLARTENDMCGRFVQDINALITGVDPATIVEDVLDSMSLSLSGATELDSISDMVIDASGLFFNAGGTMVTYVVTDTLGGSVSCTFPVMVDDNVAPTIVCPADVRQSVPTGETAAVVMNIAPMADDNCPDSLVVTYRTSGATDGLTGTDDASGTSFNLGTTTVTYTVMDKNNNVDSCSFTVLIEETSIVLDCPTDTVLFTDALACEAVLENISVVATEGAGGIDTVIYRLSGATEEQFGRDSLITIALTTFDFGSTNVSIEVRDTNGLSTVCAFEVEVRDTIAPVITCPDDQLVSVGAGASTAMVNDLAPSIFEACNDSLSYKTTGVTMLSGDGDISGSLFNLGTTIVTYIVVDEAGNVDSCSFEVVVEESNIQFVCPDDQTISTAADACSAEVADLELEITSGAELLDSIVYLISNPITGDTTFVDTVGTQIFDLGTTTVTATIFDTLGTSTVCAFNITVVDSIPPSIVCPDNVVLNVPNGTSTATAGNLMPSLSDNCTTTSLSHFTTGDTELDSTGDLSGATFNLGTTMVTYVVTDGAGLTDTCTFEVMVVEQNVGVDCPDAVTAFAGADACEAELTDISVQLSLTFGESFVDSIVYNFTLPNDEERNPISIARPNNGNPVNPVNFGGRRSYNVGTTTIEALLYNAGIVEASCVTEITVLDTIAPTLTCPSDILQTIGAADSSAMVENLAVVATDNCDSTIVSYRTTGATMLSGTGNIPDTTFNIGTTVVTYTVADTSSNEATCTFEVVVEQASIVLDCPDNINVTNDPDLCSAAVSDISVGVSAGAELIDSVSYVMTGATIDSLQADTLIDLGTRTFNVGTTTLTTTVFDALGNAVVCAFDITVTDNTPPVISCPADVNLSVAIGATGALSGDLTPTITENCPGVSLTYFTTGDTEISGSGSIVDSTFNLGTTIVTYIATDDANLSDTCSFEVSVSASAVVIDCPEDFSVNTAEDRCSIILNDERLNIEVLEGGALIDSVAYLIVRPDGRTDDFTTDSIFNLNNRTYLAGITSIEAIVYDTAATPVACRFEVSVIDSVAPSITCPADVMATVSGGDTTAIVSGLTPTASDNCDDVTVTYATTGATMLAGEDDISGASFERGTTIVTYLVTDASGNQDSCSFEVVVVEGNIQLDCPDDISVAAAADTCGAVVDGLVINVLDGEGAIDSVAYTLAGATANVLTGDSILAFNNPFFNLGTTAVNIEVFDTTGSVVTCSFNVSVVDSLAPTFVCPDDITEIILSTDTAAVLSLALMNLEDNCSEVAELNINYELTGDTETQGFGEIEDVSFNIGTTTVQYFVADATGNIDSCTFDVTVEQAAIDIICPDDLVVSSMMDTCGAMVNGIGITVLDTGALSLTTYILSGATDSVATDSILVNASGLFFNLDTTLVTYMLADTTGATQTCSFNVVVVDDSAPSLLCPDDFTVSIPEGDTVGIVNGSDLFGLITDNCDDNPSITYILSGATVDTSTLADTDIIFNLDTTTVTYFVEDMAGNMDSCSFNVNVISSPLQIVCPDDVTMAAEVDTCASVVNDIAVMVQDSGSIASITYDFSGATSLDSMGMGDASGSTFNGGTTTVTYTVTDTLGNQAMCDFDITIIDQSAPILICPDTLRVDIPDSVDIAVVNNLDPVLMDNCDVMPMLSFSSTGRTNISETAGSASGSTFDRGISLITYIATDADGNTSTCSFPIQLGDFTVNAICAGDTTVNRLADECGRIVDISSTIDRPDRIAKVDYNLSGATTGLISVDTAPFDLSTRFNEDTTLVNYNIITVARDTFACEIEVVVLDTVPMLFENCPADLILSTVPDTNFAIAAWTPPSLTDSCGATVVATHNPGDTLMLGTTEVSYFASNAQGETDTCTFLVTVQDSVAPFNFVNCPMDTVLQLAADTCSIAYDWIEPTLSDNRALDTLFSNFSPGDLFEPDTNIVSYVAISAMADTAICTFTVVVQDTIAPILVDCPSDTVFFANSANCGRIVNWTPPSVLDACEVTLTSNIEPGTPVAVGIDTVTYVARDAGGNESTCSFILEVRDTTPPTLMNCPDTIRVGLQADDCDVPVTWAEITADDNCRVGLEITSTHMSGDTFPSGTTLVTFIATDVSGNADTCSFPVIVGTGVGIQGICPDDITVTAPDSTCERPVSWTPPAFESDCSELIVTSNFAPGDTFPVGTTEVIYFIEDKRNDTTTCIFNVTVLDEELPMFTNCPTDTTITIGGADCEAVYNWESPIATDNCGIEQIDSTHASGDAFPLGETIVRYMAMDGSGNIQICEFTVRVIDDAAPMFVSCPDTVIVRSDGMLLEDPSGIITETPISDDCNAVTLVFDAPMAMDGCDTVQVTQTDATGLSSGDIFGIGTTTLTYTAIDSSGNSAECNVVIEVLPFGSIDITMVNSQICESDSITLIAAEVEIVDAVYNWFGAFRATGRIVTVAASDLRDNVAFVEVNAGDGCLLTGSIPLNVQKTPVLDIITNGATCEGSDLMLSAENIVDEFDAAADSIVTWIWSYQGVVDSLANNQNQLIANATSANSGVYQVTGISAAGCEATVTDTITIASKPMSPELNIAPLRDSACVGEEFMLIGTIDATAGITYNFAATPDTGNIIMPSDSNITSISFQEAGDYTISYWVDNNGCVSDTATVDIFIGQSPNTELTFVGATECVNADSTLQLFETGGEATAWTWLRPDSTILSTEQNPILSADSVQNGQYVLIASIGSCETRDTIEVNVSTSLMKPSIDTNLVFACTTDTLMLSILEEYDSTISFIWTSPDTNLIATPITTDTGYLELFPMGMMMDSTVMTSMVMVQAIADAGCVSEVDTIQFEIMEGPEVDLSQNLMDYTCISSDSLITLFDAAGEGDKYTWTGPCDFVGAGQTPSFLVNFDDADCKSGVYKVFVNGENGCEATDSIDIQFTTGLPQLSIVGDSAYCEGEEIVLAVDTLFTDSLAIMWEGPEGFTSSDSIIRISAESFLMGEYTVTLLGDTTTCPSVISDPFFVTVLGAPVLTNDEFTVVVDQLDSLDVLANDSLLTAGSISFSVTTSPILGNASFLDNSDKLGYRSNEGEIGNDNFTYEVCYEGCQDPKAVLCAQAIVNVNVVFPPELCVVADFLTPNGDSKNDQFIVSCAEAGEYPNNELIIFNEWGDEVFRASPYNNDWEGTYNGNELPDGTYFYIFIPEPGVDAQKGFITLFR